MPDRMNVGQRIHESVAALVEQGLPFARLKQEAPWIEAVEARLGFPIPASLRALTANYTFPSMEVGGIELFANLGDGSDEDLTVAPFRDPNLFKWLQASQRIQFARSKSGSYDPVCLMSRGNRSTPIEVFDHEDILLGRGKVKSAVLFQSLEDLFQHAAT